MTSNPPETQPVPASPRAPDPTVDVLISEHADALFRFAVARVGDRAATEDLVQETLLAAIRGRERFDERSSVRTWLIGILRHKIADLWRQKDRAPVTESDAAIEGLFRRDGMWKSRPGQWLPDPAQLAENEEFWAVAADCLDRLPAQCRSVFAMRVMDGVDSKDVCELLQVSAANLWVLLHRARLRLRECLEQRWFKPGGVE